MSKMEELWEKAEMKGLFHWQVYQLLHKYNWEIYLKSPNPNFEWHNKQRKRLNEEAIEKALIEIDYMI